MRLSDGPIPIELELEEHKALLTAMVRIEHIERAVIYHDQLWKLYLELAKQKEQTTCREQ